MECRPRSRARALFLLACLIISAVWTPLSASASGGARPKNVQVALRARWPGTPLLLEAGELLSREWKDLYWDFVDIWLQHNEHSDCQTAHSCIQKIVQVGRSLLSEPLGSIFELSLMLRSASPRLVTYRQLAKDSLSSYMELGDEVELPGQDSLFHKRKGYHLTESENPSYPRGSCCWIDTGSKLLFTVSDFQLWLDGLVDISSGSGEYPELFDFDHIYRGSSILSPVAVLYGALGTECFGKFHLLLIEAAKKGQMRYVSRPVLPHGCDAMSSDCGTLGASEVTNLGGYGVELALKNMEYKAMDDSAIKKGVTLEDPRTEDLSQDVRGFIFSKLLERRPNLRDEIMGFRDYLLSSTISDTLEVWELKDLGHQTAQRIVHASDPFQAMQEINQNFPSIVSLLSRMKLNDSIKDEISANQRMVPPGKSLLALNGALINIEDIDLYLLVDLVHEELSFADQFKRLKLPHNAIRKLLSAPPASESSTIRVDFRSPHVYYLNNLEEDSMYRRWRSNINEILMPVFPGQLRYIRKNLYHAVYVIDPGTICGAKSIELILSMYENNMPIRFGVILYSSKQISTFKDGYEARTPSSLEGVHKEDISVLMLRLFIYIKENYGSRLGFQFLNNVGKLWGAVEDISVEALEIHHIEEAFVETLVSKAKSLPQDILLKLEKDSSFKSEAELSSRFVYKLGLSNLQCCLLMNGLVYGTDEDALMDGMNEELSRLQEQVYYGHIDSNTDVLEKILSESGYPRYNLQIINGKEKKSISLASSVIGTESVLFGVNYLHTPETLDDLKPVTHLLVVNIASKEGVTLLIEGLRYLKEGTKRGRVGIIFHAGYSSLSTASLLAKTFDLSSSSYSHKGKILEFLEQLSLLYRSKYMSTLEFNSGDHQFLTEICELASANGLPANKYKESLSQLEDDFARRHINKVTDFLYGQLKLEFGANAVITNGRIILPTDDNSFMSEDFVLLESMEFEQGSKNIMDAIEGVKWSDINPDDLTSKFISDLIMTVSSSLSTRKQSSERARFEILHARYSAVVLNNEDSSIHIDAVVDPLSPSGQKLAPLLHILWKGIKPSMRIILNPMSSLVDLPLKNYYRYVVPKMDDFSHDDNSINGPKAFFANMPLSKTLTMNLDVPEPWLVEPIIAVHDLDNILLENLGDERTLQAVFELEALLLTGHCSEKDQEPPRGLQLILGTKRVPHLVDTIVMANLGYWQMKVSPGVWYLQLAPGRSSDVYELKENDIGIQAATFSKRIVINDLRGKLVHLVVAKRKGKEHDELLAIPTNDEKPAKEVQNSSSWNANLLKWVSGLIVGSGKSSQMPSSSQEAIRIGRHGKNINIFSIASGHLYERFTKIMILSVLKNTQRPVKFWFIKNYLSPQFKDVIPHMAQEYGFDYELITYKWPTWLHKQKEKQRIIWAYKILFLDVIFPLSLEKVIFVDADQVVRADMGELYDMNIKGRPLAYTPFCDNNKEMDGYRFWRQGFWRDHLRGRPYHISALYVVDLVKFRQTAAGDNLRVFYETLSKDPNSLANLDQDLPNYAQHMVPIFSLPQEWLWCESWCGNATKAKAKTIDLCNNPMTKEPKLQGARRIVSEWIDLDREAREFTARILGEKIETQDTDLTPPSQGTVPTDAMDEDLESRAEL